MKVYHYNQETKELIRESDARINPRGTTYTEVEEGSEETPQPIYSYLLPVNATFIEPPESQDGYTAVFDTDNQEWIQTLDKRGTEYWTQIDGVTAKSTITELGEDLPDGAFATEPEPTQEELDAIQAEEAAQAKAAKYATWDEETNIIFAETPSALATEFLEHVTPLQNFRRRRLPYHYISWLDNKVSNPTPEAQAVIDQLKAAALKVL